MTDTIRGVLPDDEVDKLRARLHNMADMLQTHEVKLGQHDIQISANVTSLEQVRRSAATGEQLQNAVEQFGLKLQLATEQMGSKLQLVHSDLDPIRRGIYWGVGIILASVIAAIMGLVIVKAKTG